MPVVLLAMKSTGGASPRVFRLQRATTVIGRSHHCHLRLPLPSVALRQCEVRVIGDRAGIFNLHNDATVRLNGAAVQTADLADGDLLHIGPVEFLVSIEEVSADTRQSPVSIEVKDRIRVDGPPLSAGDEMSDVPAGGSPEPSEPSG